MRAHARLPVILAQEAGADRRRDAGLRGDALRNAVLGLSAVFLLGLVILAVVVLSARRGRRPGPSARLFAGPGSTGDDPAESPRRS